MSTPMTDGVYSLAIETSSRQGSLALGRGDALLECVELPEQRRHAVELLPIADAMLRRHGLTPRELTEVYVSVGPGSFTGLRVGITTAKLLGRAVGARLVAVPTLDVIVRNAPETAKHVAVCLNAKRGQCFTGLFDRGEGGFVPRIAPSLLTPQQMLDAAPRPLRVIGDTLDQYTWPADVELADKALATPRAEVVWRLGRAMAREGRLTGPQELVPLYVRLPEAEELWRSRQAAALRRGEEAKEAER